MADVPLNVTLEGEDADEHQLPAYDGFMALAGISLTLSLVTNYASTGKLRKRGNFEGRLQVKTLALKPGSVDVPFLIHAAMNSPIITGGITVTTGIVTNFIYDLLKRTIRKNIGIEHDPETPLLRRLESDKQGDLEALASAAEPSLRQAHTVINNGAHQIIINGGTNHISTFDPATKDYINLSIEDDQVIEKDVSVAAFNANSGVGRIYDADYGRTIPIYLADENFERARSVLGWGLNEYSKRTGKKISLTYRRTLAWDGTPKRYVVLDAEIPND